MRGIPPPQEVRYMDNYRRRPPMEGFSRPGQLGGEAFDNDEVEGHIMDERDDIPGEGITRRGLDEDDTEGHKATTRSVDEDDTEGHRATTRSLTDDDDTEGHRATTRSLTDDDDTEGHAVTKRS
jgi:hypothetical protein